MKFKNKGNKSGEILIYEEIGEGWFGGIGAKSFAKELKELGTLDEINVRINSDGGNVFDGIAIYNQLRRNGARIIVDIDGLAASIASVIAMAGDEIRIAENATLMYHDPWGVVAGTADQIRTQADLLDQVRDQLIDTYAQQASIDREQIGDEMTAETWLTAAQALDRGLVTEITGEMQMAAHWDLTKFKHPPSTLLEQKNMVQIDSTKPADNDASVKLSRMAARARAIT